MHILHMSRRFYNIRIILRTVTRVKQLPVAMLLYQDESPDTALSVMIELFIITRIVDYICD